MMWHLQEGIQLVRNLQPEVRKCGFHVLLGGGVLNKGMSDNDLDLYFIPLEEHASEIKKLTQLLDSRLGQPVKNDNYDASESSYRIKSIYGFGPREKRIDVFIV